MFKTSFYSTFFRGLNLSSERINIMLQTSFFGKSDTGLKRPNNEDAFIIKPESGFCAVADGMGGAEAGELASKVDPMSRTVFTYF